MNKMTLMTIASLSLVLAACQKTNMSQKQETPSTAFAPAPVQPLPDNPNTYIPPGNNDMPADTTVRYPEDEPRDFPVVVNDPVTPRFPEDEPIDPLPVDDPVTPRFPEDEPRDPVIPVIPRDPPIIPEIPVNPDVPVNPVTPIIPDVPVRPETPITPVNPYIPENPVIPRDPPIRPVNPVVPMLPVLPVLPDNPDDVPPIIKPPVLQPDKYPLPAIIPIPIPRPHLETDVTVVAPPVVKTPVVRKDVIIDKQTVVKNPPGKVVVDKKVVEKEVVTTPKNTPVPVVRPTSPTEVCGEGETCGAVEAKDGQCVGKPVTIATNNKMLDILFVVDTSASLVNGPKGGGKGGELQQLASQMQNFVDKLDRDTDIRIAVMLGHGPSSKYFGKLFTFGKGDPAVLDSKQMTTKQMWQVLERKMKNVPNDKSEAQGEALMMNIYQSIMDPVLRDQIVAQGLFRTNSRLAIIGVTDEQDVCYNYGGQNYPTPDLMEVNQDAFSKGLVPVLKPRVAGKKSKAGLGPDVHEMAFFQEVCSNFIGGRANKARTKYENGAPLTSLEVQKVLESLEAKRNLHVLMNLIAYKSNDGLSAQASNQDENEMAHGILEVQSGLGSGDIADLRNVKRGGETIDFTQQLGLLGQSVRLNSKATSVFKCESNENPFAVDPSSVYVDILDRKTKQRLSRLTAECETAEACQQGDGGLKLEAVVKNGYFLKVRPLDQTKFLKSIETKDTEIDYVIHYRTRENYDTRTGKPTRVLTPTREQLDSEHKQKVETRAKSPVEAADRAGADKTTTAKKVVTAQKPVVTKTAVVAKAPVVKTASLDPKAANAKKAADAKAAALKAKTPAVKTAEVKTPVKAVALTPKTTTKGLMLKRPAPAIQKVEK